MYNTTDEGLKKETGYFIVVYQPRIAFRSSSGVVIGAILKFSTRKFRTLGEMNAGSVGPSRIFLMPRCSRVSRIHTAFCLHQDKAFHDHPGHRFAHKILNLLNCSGMIHSPYSTILPSGLMVTICSGIFFPLFSMAVFTA